MPYACAGSGRGRSLVTSVRVPPRWPAAANGRAATQTPDPAATILSGVLPTEMTRLTRLVSGSIRCSVALNSPLTHTPSLAAAIAPGPSPTPMVAVTLPVTGSSLDTVRSSELATHTAAGVIAMPLGPEPTGTGPLGWPVAGSIR